MANLFLKPAATPLWYPLIARELAESPFTITELEAICRDEVGPSMWLKGTVGAAGFDEGVTHLIEMWLDSKVKLPVAFPHQDWKSVALLTASLRHTGRAQWPRKTKAWGVLARIFLDPDPILPTLDLSVEELDSMWIAEISPAYEHTIGNRVSKEEVERVWAHYRHDS